MARFKRTKYERVNLLLDVLVPLMWAGCNIYMMFNGMWTSVMFSTLIYFIIYRNLRGE